MKSLGLAVLGSFDNFVHSSVTQGLLWGYLTFGLERKSLPLAVYLAPCPESEDTGVGGAEHNRVGTRWAFSSQLCLAPSL